MLHVFSKPKYKILVGTHHKTGSVWMTSVFSGVAKRLNLKFQRVSSTTPVAPSGNWDIFFNSHSQFDLSALTDFRGLHLVRDPRDQIISAAFYHAKSDESWLHERRADLGGSTYKEKINSYPNFEDRLSFEMEHSARIVLQRMSQFDIEDQRFLTQQYESLVNDEQLTEFRRLFNFLGFKPSSMKACLHVAYENSLFSGRQQSAHVRSGIARQWPKYFGARHKERFLALFPGLLERYGYDGDPDWDDL